MISPTNHKIGPTPGAGRGEQPAGAGRHSFQTRPKTDGFLTESAVRLPAPHLRMAIRDGLAVAPPRLTPRLTPRRDHIGRRIRRHQPEDVVDLLGDHVQAANQRFNVPRAVQKTERLALGPAWLSAAVVTAITAVFPRTAT